MPPTTTDDSETPADDLNAATSRRQIKSLQRQVETLRRQNDEAQAAAKASADALTTVEAEARARIEALEKQSRQDKARIAALEAQGEEDRARIEALEKAAQHRLVGDAATPAGVSSSSTLSDGKGGSDDAGSAAGGGGGDCKPRSCNPNRHPDTGSSPSNPNSRPDDSLSTHSDDDHRSASPPRKHRRMADARAAAASSRRMQDEIREFVRQRLTPGGESFVSTAELRRRFVAARAASPMPSDNLFFRLLKHEILDEYPQAAAYGRRNNVWGFKGLRDNDA